MKRFQPDFLYLGQEGFRRNYGLVEDKGKILAVVPSEELEQRFPETEVCDWSGLAMVPGTVNAHNHCFQSLLRGIAVDRPFLEWRNLSLYRYSPKMTEEDIYTGALFAFAEMMKCGVTTVCDFFYLHNFGLESDEAVIRAARDLGIRLVLARTMYDWHGAPTGYVETVKQAVERIRYLAVKYQGSEMISVLPAPHSLHAASPEMVVAGYRLAKELGTKYHIHVAEEPFEIQQVQKEHGGLRPVEYLHTLGVIDEHTVIIHGVWLEPNEIRLLGETGAGLVYCPSSNMFLADGVTDIPAMLNAGVTVALGSDGACANSRVSIFEEMRMTALLQKVKTLDALSVNYKQAFQMGTENGGILTETKTGTLQPGSCADFVGIDWKDFSVQPISENAEQLLPNLVYSMQPGAVRKVVVNGISTVDDGKFTRLTEQSVVEAVSRTIEHLQNGKEAEN